MTPQFPAWQPTSSAPRNGEFIVMREHGLIEYKARWFAGRWRNISGTKVYPSEWLLEAPE